MRAGPCSAGCGFPSWPSTLDCVPLAKGLSLSELVSSASRRHGEEVPKPAQGTEGEEAVAELTSRGSCEHGGRRLQAEGPAWAQAGWHQLCWRLSLWNVKKKKRKNKRTSCVDTGPSAPAHFKGLVRPLQGKAYAAGTQGKVSRSWESASGCLLSPRALSPSDV